MEQLKPCPFQTAKAYLSGYYETHRTGIKEVITSQWARGFVDGRAEALKILEEASDKARAAPRDAGEGQ